MSNEITVKYASVEKSLLETLNASENVSTSIPSPGTGKNQLASLDAGESTMKELSYEIQRYNEVLQTQINKTKQLIQQLKHTDEMIAAGIRKGTGA